jgi:hypothetical protein
LYNIYYLIKCNCMKDEIQSFKNLVANNNKNLDEYHIKIDDLRKKLKDENLSDD